MEFSKGLTLVNKLSHQFENVLLVRSAKYTSNKSTELSKIQIKTINLPVCYSLELSILMIDCGMHLLQGIIRRNRRYGRTQDLTTGMPTMDDWLHYVTANIYYSVFDLHDTLNSICTE